MSSPGFGLPETFESVGDPSDGNPFPEDHPGHRVWTDVTRRAEEAVCRIRAKATAAPFGTLVDACHWHANLVASQFDVWAERSISVVWSERALKGFDEWLVRYANAWLEMLAQHFASHPSPIPAYSNDVLMETRNRLSGRVHYWKAEVRRYRAQQEEHAKTAGDRPGAVGAAIVKRRKRLIQEYRTAHGLTVADFARRLGMSETAVRGIIKEDRSRFAQDKRDKLLSVLGVSQSSWYRG